jgi:hypothetical protein
VRFGRRPPFFLATAALCLILLPVSPSEFRWVNLACAGLALFWAIVIGIEDVAASRRKPSRSRSDRAADPSRRA